MEPTRFDALARAMTTKPTRRGIAHALTNLAFGSMLVPLLGIPEAAARKKKKRRGKGKKKRGQSAPPSPTCTDGIQNGTETGIDCGGGSCPRCANGQGCVDRDDCAGAFCIDGVCQLCRVSPNNCGSDGGGSCFCSQPEGSEIRTCVQGDPTGDEVTNCAACPPGTFCFDFDGPGAIYCYSRCGAS